MQASEPDIASDLNGLQRAAIKLGDTISTLCTQVSGLALIIVAICTTNVIARYCFYHAFIWAEEAMVYCMVFIIFFASAAVTWRGQHLHLDMLLRKFPSSVQKGIVYVSVLASVAMLLLLSYMSFGVVERLYRFAQRSEALEVPMWIPQGFVPVGLALIAVMMLLRLVCFDPLPRPIDFEEEDQML